MMACHCRKKFGLLKSKYNMHLPSIYAPTYYFLATFWSKQTRMNAAMVNLPVVTFFISIDMLCGGPSSLTLRNPRGMSIARSCNKLIVADLLHLSGVVFELR